MGGMSYYPYVLRNNFPSRQVEQSLRPGPVQSTENIDIWLTEYFSVAPENLPSALEGDDENAFVTVIVTRALALYGELARACVIPTFALGHVTSAIRDAADSNLWHISVDLPVVDNLPPDLLPQLFQHSLKTIVKLIGTKPSLSAVEKIWNELGDIVLANKQILGLLGSTALPICDLAFRNNIPFRHQGSGVMRFGWGTKSQTIVRGGSNKDSATGAFASGDKQQAAAWMRALGMPAPEHLPVSSREEALNAARQLGWPVVIKPSDRDRSEGVTANITNASAVTAAFEKARKLSKNILVERHVSGFCHRIMVANDRVIYAVKRMSKCVLGNGKDSVAKLVAAANAAQAKLPPWRRFNAFPLDDLARRCLATQRLTPQSVPKLGQYAPLRPLYNEEAGGALENVTANIHPDNAQLALDVARSFGLHIAGIDLLIDDISQPWHQCGAIINEINYRPQFSLRAKEQEAATLIPALFEDDGRIPVHLVTGKGDLMAEAKALQARLAQQGRHCHLTSSSHTDDSHGRVIPMACTSLFDRTLALTMRPDVEEFIIVGDAKEVLEGGLAIDLLESVFVVGGNVERTDEDIRRGINVRTPAPVLA